MQRDRLKQRGNDVCGLSLSSLGFTDCGVEANEKTNVIH